MTENSPDIVSLRRLNQIDAVLRWLRSCAICHDMRPPIDVLCRRCRQELADSRCNESQQPDYPFLVHALYRWNDASAASLRPTLHALKGGWAPRFVADATSELLHLIGTDKRPQGSLVFVHPPASPGRPKRDHAWLMAHLLAARFCDARVVALEHLAGDDRESQKSKSARERAKRRLRCPPLEKISRSNGYFVLVDDVITTGSTASAAFTALGAPERFAVWTLACRPKLAGKSGIW